MWFDEETKAAWEYGLMPGSQDAGYVPYRIDLRDDVNKIDEEIIPETRKSRFVVADLTHGDWNARFYCLRPGQPSLTQPLRDRSLPRA